ncbi:DinB family protein [Mucilaginibacter paludis]|uniref:DinB-like domain-containing protein n=1 Tax=Mucilaginibacter paludis DSM 18603 TaxID=714943 RepID=H1Y576_9SPHI|nr:DinB family protein [Mucilaginibacter paludis]EHQ28619.1 hypothetical protein Mucpa_4529 [Mucilaginibacter paludis DSM 18603]
MKIHEQTLNRLQNQHKIIRHYIDDLPPQALYNRIDKNKWSIHENIAHLARYQYIFYSRVVQILEESNPHFEPYDGDKDTEFRFFVSKSTGPLLHDLYRIRQDLTNLLSDLPEGQYSRTATHAKYGKMNLCQWVEFFVLHESNHLFKIFKLSSKFWQANHSAIDTDLYNSELDHALMH